MRLSSSVQDWQEARENYLQRSCSGLAGPDSLQTIFPQHPLPPNLHTFKVRAGIGLFHPGEVILARFADCQRPAVF
jgi:hypothetical protein